MLKNFSIYFKQLPVDWSSLKLQSAQDEDSEWGITWSPRWAALLFGGSEQKGLCGITHKWQSLYR